MSYFDNWDNFDFDNADSRFTNEMIKRGAEMGIDLGLSQSAAKQELRDRGFSFGNQKFSDLWRGIQDEQAGFNHFRSIGMNDYAFDDILPDKDYFNSRYRYIGSFEERDENGNFKRRTTLALDIDDQLTPNEVLALLADVALNSYGASNSELDSLQIQGALFNSSYQYE